jgi:hypothetical protein
MSVSSRTIPDTRPTDKKKPRRGEENAAGKLESREAVVSGAGRTTYTPVDVPPWLCRAVGSCWPTHACEPARRALRRCGLFGAGLSSGFLCGVSACRAGDGEVFAAVRRVGVSACRAGDGEVFAACRPMRPESGFQPQICAGVWRGRRAESRTVGRGCGVEARRHEHPAGALSVTYIQ